MTTTNSTGEWVRGGQGEPVAGRGGLALSLSPRLALRALSPAVCGLVGTVLWKDKAEQELRPAGKNGECHPGAVVLENRNGRLGQHSATSWASAPLGPQERQGPERPWP